MFLDSVGKTDYVERNLIEHYYGLDFGFNETLSEFESKYRWKIYSHAGTIVCYFSFSGLLANANDSIMSIF